MNQFKPYDLLDPSHPLHLSYIINPSEFHDAQPLNHRVDENMDGDHFPSITDPYIAEGSTGLTSFGAPESSIDEAAPPGYLPWQITTPWHKFDALSECASSSVEGMLSHTSSRSGTSLTSTDTRDSSLCEAVTPRHISGTWKSAHGNEMLLDDDGGRMVEESSHQLDYLRLALSPKGQGGDSGLHLQEYIQPEPLQFSTPGHKSDSYLDYDIHPLNPWNNSSVTCHYPPEKSTNIRGQIKEERQTRHTVLPEESGEEQKNVGYICYLCAPSNRDIYCTLSNFKRHVCDMHRRQWEFRCPYMDCKWAACEREKVYMHICLAHRGRPSTKRIAKCLNPHPQGCDLCSTYVTSWNTYFSCLFRHCRMDNAGSNHRSTGDRSSLYPLPWGDELTKPSLPFSDQEFSNGDEPGGECLYYGPADAIHSPSLVQHNLLGLTPPPSRELDLALRTHVGLLEELNSRTAMEPSSVQATTKSEAPGLVTITDGVNMAASNIEHGSIIGTGTELIPTLRDCRGSPEPGSEKCTEVCIQDNRSPGRSPNGIYSDDQKSTPESGSPDSDDYDIYEDGDSIFGEDNWTSSSELHTHGANTRRLKTLYANCLYWLIYRQVFRSCPTNGAASESDTPGSSQSKPNSSSMDPPASKGKRKAEQISGNGNGGSDNGDGQDDGNGSTPSQHSKTPRSQGPVSPRFACPFFKRHPDMFMSCGMSDHETPSRVKLHINRKHRLPIYCPRCSKVFKSERERDSHLRENSCPVKPEVERICATSEQVQQLSRRSTAKTDEEKWNEIYKILFPGDPFPDSPYLDPTVSAEVNLVREAFLNAAPTAVRTAIQLAIPEEHREAWADELERAVTSTHIEVFDQVLSRMRSTRSGSLRRPARPQSSSQWDFLETPDSGIGTSVNAADPQAEERLSGESQENAFDPIISPGIDHDRDLQGLSLEQIATSFPFDWSFSEPDDALMLSSSPAELQDIESVRR